MKTYASRRLANLTILFIFLLLNFFIYKIYSLSLSHSGFVTGWTLLILIIVLALFNARKRLPFLPLFSSSNWLQFHIYAGLLTFFIFLFHIDFRLPNGLLELILTGIYLTVMLSGLFGLFITRTFPKRLTGRKEEVIFERIPVFRRQLQQELDVLISRSVDESGSLTLFDFYTHRLIFFFTTPKYFWWHIVESSRPRDLLLNELNALIRYMNDFEQEITGDILELIGLKDDLDYQYAHQKMLKYWLFIHIPITYSLLIVSGLHGIMVYAFMGGN